MGIFQSKTYDVQKEEVKTIPRNKKSDRPKSRTSVKSKSDTLPEHDSTYIVKSSGDTLPQHDSTYIPLKPTDDATKINNFGLNLPDYDENEPEDKVTETNKREEQTSSAKAAENSEIANAAVSEQSKSINSETVPAQVENNVPEERESKSENKNEENPDAILVVNEEPVVESTPLEKEELAERQRSRSIAIENEIFQAVAHIPERRDSRMADVTKEETPKNQLPVQEENTQSLEEKVNSTLDINSTEVLRNEKKLELAEPTKIQPESPVEVVSSVPVQVDQEQLIHKSQEMIKKEPEEAQVEAILEETVHLHESEFKKVKIGVPKENALRETESKKEETIETDICKLQDVRENNNTTNDDNSKAEATIEKQNDICAIEAEIKVDQEISREDLEQKQVKNEETNESSSKLEVNEEANKVELKDQNKSININQEAACQRVVVQETEKQNEAITTETDQKKENIAIDHDLEEQNVINHSKDDNSGKVATEEPVVLTEAERAEIIEEMCSKVNQVPLDLESRRISLIMKDVAEAKVQEKEPLEKHVAELQEQNNSSTKRVSENLHQIQEIEADVKTIKAQVIHFSGTSQDSEYLTLHETLIRNIIKLDDILVENDDEGRQERKRVIKFTQQCLNDLEGKLQKSKASDDSDSE